MPAFPATCWLPTLTTMGAWAAAGAAAGAGLLAGGAPAGGVAGAGGGPPPPPAGRAPPGGGAAPRGGRAGPHPPSLRPARSAGRPPARGSTPDYTQWWTRSVARPAARPSGGAASWLLLKLAAGAVRSSRPLGEPRGRGRNHSIAPARALTCCLRRGG